MTKSKTPRSAGAAKRGADAPHAHAPNPPPADALEVPAPVSASAQSPVISPSPQTGEPKGKLGILVALLRRPDGASLEAMTAATGWQAHSVRGAMSGALKKKRGLLIISEKMASGRVWRIEGPAA